MPVLPDDGSTIVWPGTRWPCFSASSIIALAMRSFTDPNGFWLSSLARIRTSGLGESTDTSTSGVLPIRSSTLLFTLAMVSMIRVPFRPGRDGVDVTRHRRLVSSTIYPLDRPARMCRGSQATRTGSSVASPSAMR